MSANDSVTDLGGKYQALLARNGAAGTREGNMMIASFTDGVRSGYEAHVALSVAALNEMASRFQKPVSIETARQAVLGLAAAMVKGATE